MSKTGRNPGPLNLITDVAGLQVGNAGDSRYPTGVTVLLPDEPAVAGADVRGGAPGTREVAALDPACLVGAVHAIVLAGGSVFGLAAADGVTAWLSERGRGLEVGTQPRAVPVVPSAILFDLGFGPARDWGLEPPYRRLGIAAARAAAKDFALGNAGAGLGATAGRLKGGLGSASVVHDAITVGALVAVNAVGSAVDPATGRLWAEDAAFAGDLGAYARTPVPADAGPFAACKPGPFAAANTTIAVVATDAVLDKACARRMAVMASDGLARAIRPAHTPFDGDTVFAVSTGAGPADGTDPRTLAVIGALAADSLCRAIGRAMLAAEPGHGWPGLAR